MTVTTIKLFEITGRMKDDPKAKIYRMKIFSANSVVARSRFWYYISLMKRVKRANGEIISVHEIFEKNANYIKNFGMWIRYDSRSGTHNMYKEYRATSLNSAVEKMYSELASRHRARKSSVQIVRTAVVKAKDCKRANTLQFHDSKIQFRLMHRIPRPQSKEFRKTFKATKPTTFF
jgi:large subunit ribosomal protein L18Ae